MAVTATRGPLDAYRSDPGRHAGRTAHLPAQGRHRDGMPRRRTTRVARPHGTGTRTTAAGPAWGTAAASLRLVSSVGRRPAEPSPGRRTGGDGCSPGPAPLPSPPRPRGKAAVRAARTRPQVFAGPTP